ncbi:MULTISPECIES: retropepsin-like aspartic protease family protein [unclassified Dinoroseobacter]|uniref:retropepsin-like aspartic protease family protein n=1 Tax=unclassified Dinoroseobacter TaxID=2620028 RepID=UPI003C7DB45B
MDENAIGNVIYLLLLLALVGGGTLMAFRGQLGAMLRTVGVWALLFALVVIGYGMFNDQRSIGLPQQAVFAEAGRVEIPRSRDGHYHVVLDVNGTPIEFIVDTGASEVVLSRADALRAGINPENLMFSGLAQTANGRVETAPVRLREVRLGAIEDENVRAVVNGGEMRKSLLGMSYLNSFDRIEINEGRLILERGA